VSGESEVVEGEVVEHGLTVRGRFENGQPDVATQVADAAAKLELKWMQEKEERAKWKAEDHRAFFYAGLVGRMAAACLAEGAAGVRPTPKHVAELAANYADAIMLEIDTRQAKRDAESKARAAAAEKVAPAP